MIADPTAAQARNGQQPDPPPLIAIDDVGKTYARRDGGTSVAIESFSAHVDRGEFVALVGPSGCGKTTLLKILAGLVHATTGDIVFHGTAHRLEPREFGMVFQTPALLPWKKVIRNVTQVAELMGRDRRQARERALELLATVRLSDAADLRPNELSGGMQQRVSIARALVHDPELLFMDEPFGALDALTREELNGVLQDIHMAERKTVVFVTHDISEAVFLADRILVFSHRPSRLAADIAVPLERPRTTESRASEAFRSVENEVRGHLTLK